MGLMSRSQRTLCVHAEMVSLRLCSTLMSKPEPGVYPGSWFRRSSFLRRLACAAASGRVPPSPCRQSEEGSPSLQTPAVYLVWDQNNPSVYPGSPLRSCSFLRLRRMPREGSRAAPAHASFPPQGVKGDRVHVQGLQILRPPISRTTPGLYSGYWLCSSRVAGEPPLQTREGSQVAPARNMSLASVDPVALTRHLCEQSHLRWCVGMS